MGRGRGVGGGSVVEQLVGVCVMFMHVLVEGDVYVCCYGVVMFVVCCVSCTLTSHVYCIHLNRCRLSFSGINSLVELLEEDSPANMNH